MAKKIGPYIGVTGFMSRTEVTEALGMIPLEPTRRLMVGVLMSSKTLLGQANKWPGRYPEKDAIAEIFVKDQRALNLIHYTTDNPRNLYMELREVVSLAGPLLDGFQLNVKWPKLSSVYLLADAFPQLYLLVQIGGSAMAEARTMGTFREEVSWYTDFIDAVLIDPSGGRGEPFESAKGVEYLRAIADFPLGLGIAGGLGPRALDVIDPLIAEFPNLSIDAEGRLRTSQPEDALDLTSVREYLREAYAKFENVS